VFYVSAFAALVPHGAAARPFRRRLRQVHLEHASPLRLHCWTNCPGTDDCDGGPTVFTALVA